MPRRGGRLNGRFNDEADSQPLFVSSREDLSTRTSSPASASADNVLFSVDDDDADDNDKHETSALAAAQDDTLRRAKADQTVRFQEHVQVIAPSLRSTLESREAGASVLPRDLSVYVFVCRAR
jgi:sodium-coupled neutral amino acid transporter 11